MSIKLVTPSQDVICINVYVPRYYSYVMTFLYSLCNSSGVFLVCGECAETHFVPALLAQLDHCLVKELSVATLHSGRYNSPQQAVISVSKIFH